MSRARLRAATTVGVSCLVAAGVLGIAALVVGGSDDRRLTAPAASLEVTPSTVAPRAVAPATTDPAPTTAAPTTLPTSPLAAALGEAVTAVPPPVLALPPPVRLSIDALGVDVAVRAVGVEADGQLEIPDETEVGWYRLGASPGEAGAAVFAGHVNWNGVDGPFVGLNRLEPGATVSVRLEDGTVRTYQVVERRQYDKSALPGERIWTTTGPETLVLITCGGAFNPDIRRYRDNVVVYAVPVA